MKKVFLVIAMALAFYTCGHADTQWTATSGTVPNDGTTYYISTAVSLTGTLNINGILEIRTGGSILVITENVLNVNQSGTLNIKQGEVRLSLGEMYIYGNVYTYKKIDSGFSGSGRIDINFPGNIFLLGGELEQNHSGSDININQGGALYNYFGIIDISDGDMTLKTGGKFHHARGSFEHNSFSAQAGSIFKDTKKITLDKSLDIDYTWTITGKAVLCGAGNKIIFGSQGAIVIDKDASLLLKDVMVHDVSGSQIRCIDNTSTLTIDNVGWLQDDDYTFTKGRICVAGDWTIAGDYTTFSYESDQTSTIKKDATVTTKFITLKYNASASDSLIEMEDPTSIIHLDRATLLAQKPWTLSSGTLMTTGSTTLQGIATLDLRPIGAINMHVATTEIGSVLL